MLIYEIPDDINSLFKEVDENDGSVSYRIIDYGEGMSMDNNESMQYFVDCVGISQDSIEEDLGTQIALGHSRYSKRIIVDSGGLGDFFSHGFDCYWEE